MAMIVWYNIAFLLVNDWSMTNALWNQIICIPPPPICNLFLCDSKAEFFCIITAVFSITWSFWNHYNMLICFLKNISCYYQCWKKVVLPNIHVKNNSKYVFFTFMTIKLLINIEVCKSEKIFLHNFSNFINYYKLYHHHEIWERKVA